MSETGPSAPRVESRWLPMRDGVRIAIDLVLPASDEGAPFPAVMMMTRYWRSFALRTPPPRGKAPMGPRAPIADALVARDFAVVVVDARGTGASEGTWLHPWSAEELTDYRQVVDWVVAQPWSNGRVGATGISYEGTAALLVAATGHPAIRAVAPRSFELDIYPDVALPGGVLNRAFLKAWSDSARSLDANKAPALFGTMGRLVVRGVRPVDEDPGGRQLSAIVAARQNPDVFGAMSNIEYRDDQYGDQPITLDKFSVARYLPHLRHAKVPAQVWASWRDGTTADSALRLFAVLPAVREVHIGAWSHTGEQHASPFREGSDPVPPLTEQWERIMAFLEGPLRGQGRPTTDTQPTTADEPTTGGEPTGPEQPTTADEHTGPDLSSAQRVIHYFTMGAEEWRSTPAWPPDGMEPVTLYLEAGGQLSTVVPRGATMDRHRLDPRASTGTSNRWHTQLARPVEYGNRAAADRQAATWTGVPLGWDTEMTGSPELRVFVRTEGHDLALFAYLEAVDTVGRVRMLTEGMLRLIHRAPRGLETTFLRGDALPIRPTEPMEVGIRMLTTSVVVPEGWSIRVALTGADADTFQAPTSARELDITLEYSRDRPATLTLPIRTS